MRRKRFFLIMLLCVLITKICNAGLYYDEKNKITYNTDCYSIYESIFNPKYIFAIAGNKKIICYKRHNAPKYILLANELPPRGATVPFYERYKYSGADIAFFLVGGDEFLGRDNDHKGICDIYVKTFENSNKDICVLPKKKLDEVLNHYVNQLRQTCVDVKEYRSKSGIVNRNNTIQIIGYEQNRQVCIVKRIVGRYGKMIETEAYFKYSKDLYELDAKLGNQNYYRHADAISSIIDVIVKNIDLDNSLYIDEKIQEINWIEIIL